MNPVMKALKKARWSFPEKYELTRHRPKHCRKPKISTSSAETQEGTGSSSITRELWECEGLVGDMSHGYSSSSRAFPTFLSFLRKRSGTFRRARKTGNDAGVNIEAMLELMSLGMRQ